MTPPNMKVSSNRMDVPESCIRIAEALFHESLKFRLNQKGTGTFKSTHEILGILTEEYKELLDAVQGNSVDKVRAELLDIAVGSVFSVACILADSIDW